MITPVSQRTTPGKPKSGRRFVVTALTLLMVAVGSLTSAAPAPAATPYWRCSRLTPINGGPTAVSACVNFTPRTRGSSATVSVEAVLHNGTSVSNGVYTTIAVSDQYHGSYVAGRHAWISIAPHSTRTLSITQAVDSNSGKYVVGFVSALMPPYKTVTASASWRH